MRDLGIPVALAVAFVLSGCVPIGSGNIVTESHPVDEFDSVEVESGIKVELVIDPAGASAVEVVYDDNLQERILVSVDAGSLHVSANGNLSPFSTEGRMVRITTPDLVALKVTGGSQIEADGTLDELELEVAGGSTASLGNLVVGDVMVAISGGSTATVNASNAINGDVDGGASLTIEGDPAFENVTAEVGATLDG